MLLYTKSSFCVLRTYPNTVCVLLASPVYSLVVLSERGRSFCKIMQEEVGAVLIIPLGMWALGRQMGRLIFLIHENALLSEV